MVRVYLQSDGGKTIDNLPMVCIKCGAPATVRKSKKFTWTPPEVRRALWWTPWIFDLILTARRTKRQWVETPLCEAHKGYWWKLATLMNSLIVAVFALGVTAAIVIWVRTRNSDLTQDVCMGTLTAFVVLAIVATVMGKSRIRVEKITDQYIVLTGVSQKFIDAVEDEVDRLPRGSEK
jgi:hypothetical protein